MLPMARKEWFRDAAVIGGLLVLALIPRLALIFSKGFEIFHSDHAIFGLMAKHILEGKPMIYYYGQGYMGPMDSWMAVLLFLIGGMNLFTLQLAPMMFYLLFLVVNFYLLRRLFGFEVSFMANLLLAISPPALNIMCATLECYPETFFLGSLILLGLIRYSESGNRLTLFLTGLAGGLALWTNNLILFYFMPIGILWLLRTPFWARIYPTLTWCRVLLLEDVKVPALIRWAAVFCWGPPPCFCTASSEAKGIA